MNKTACIVGMAIGAVIVVIGLLIVSGGITVFESSYPGYRYDYGYGSFGADFYTYVSNNAAQAAYNVIHVGNALEKICGILLSCFGAFEICLFWAFLGKKELASLPAEDVIRTEATVSPASDMNNMSGLNSDSTTDDGSASSLE